MSIEVNVPILGESVSEATVATWLKKEGDRVNLDEPLVELETDKVTLEVNSPISGTLSSILCEEGAEVEVGALLCVIDEGTETSVQISKQVSKAMSPPKLETGELEQKQERAAGLNLPALKTLSPAVRKLVDDNNLDPNQIKPSGKDGRLLKTDVLGAIENGTAKVFAQSSGLPIEPNAKSSLPPRPDDPREERVKMNRLRQVIARRLKEAQNTAAMLTTYNEVDMGAIMELRSEYRETFEKKHGVRLGFMSFFIKACVNALKELPAVNAEIYNDEIIYKNFYDIGVAVGTPQGLVVPVLREADKLGFAQLEKSINDFGVRARDGKLAIEEMKGGTFTISNGGVYGSLMSSPILNPPQSGILGMHKIQSRPMAVNGVVEIRSMMYLALSYDHRIVDGREAVTFLVRVKEALEDPRRLLIDM
ncbi:2-oxoglutarate dehydrogenase complex dihydrolipoyllysine-residue succinyltransferase [Alphaproteobacteria bacterium]|nr:2-oxoglutarate dehydrogenase complex dihydrolipoyllysine-residue succinyltransferase [Alphaproteobacteria bacterium]